MYKFIMMGLLALLLSGCVSGLNIEPVPKADNSDLSSLNDCKTIDNEIALAEEKIDDYKGQKISNTIDNMFWVSSFMLLTSPSEDEHYIDNSEYDFDNAIVSFEERIKKLKDLKSQLCK